jgi:hypothetical protein
MQERTGQRRHRRVGGEERVRAFEHWRLKHCAVPWIVAGKHGAQMPAQPFVRESRLRNYRLGAPPLYFVQNFERCHIHAQLKNLTR